MESRIDEGGDTVFKDYCLILQVHPDADAEIIDAAYWHLARRYGEARATDPTARERMDDLNEAYTVMRSPLLRDEFSRQRAAVLGVGTLPVAPPPTPAAQEPLAMPIMERQRQRLAAPPSESKTFGLKQARIPMWQNLMAAVVMLLLAGVALSGWLDRPLMAALLIFGLAFTAVPMFRLLPRPSAASLSLAGATMQSVRFPDRDGGSPTPGVDADSLLSSTTAIRARMRNAGTAQGVAEGEVPPLETPRRRPGRAA